MARRKIVSAMLWVNKGYFWCLLAPDMETQRKLAGLIETLTL
jgi:hypothetical protein